VAAVRRIADFIGVGLSENRLDSITAAVSFNAMKQRGQDYAPSGGETWKGGADTFLNKGVNGRWRDIFSANELALYDDACARALTPDCRAWLENGGAI
jgi:aryl sulfotransferase